MNTTHTSNIGLRELLNAEYRSLCHYVSVAETEADALTGADADLIGTFAARKQAALDQVAGARAATRRAIGEPISPPALSEKLKAAGPGATEVFELILVKAREAQEINHVASRLIAHQLGRLSQRSAILVSAGLSAPTSYGESGFPRLTGGSASRGSA